MAENEMLDVGSSRRYRKWRNALGDSMQSPEALAGILEEEFVSTARNSLRRTPLYLILRACGNEPAVMQAAIESCKNRDLARYAEQAYRSTRSRNIDVLADHIARGLTDQVQERARVYVGRQLANLGPERCRAVLAATEVSLGACHKEVCALVRASLLNERLPRQKSVSKRVQSPRTLAGQSLLVPTHRWVQRPADHA